jgi:hypothetical protein
VLRAALQRGAIKPVSMGRVKAVRQKKSASFQGPDAGVEAGYFSGGT